MRTYVKEIRVENFTIFRRNSFEFTEGINVLIGKNSTGKTILMKLLYSVLDVLRRTNTVKKDAEFYLRDKLKGVFLIERVGRLATRRQGVISSRVSIRLTSGETVSFSFSSRGDGIKIEEELNLIGEIGNCIYIPPKEILSLMDRGIIGVLEEKKSIMEQIYLDLAKKLDVPLSAGRYDEQTRELLKKFQLENLSNITRQHKEFYVYMRGTGRLESKLLAEGYRKLATIIYLIKNGQLTEGTYLFWDEPEANLNPSLSELLVDLIVFLSKELKVQVFMATHDYFIPKYLDIKCREQRDLPLLFISLYTEGDELRVERGEKLYDIKNNPIFDEFEKVLKKDAEYGF